MRQRVILMSLYPIEACTFDRSPPLMTNRLTLAYYMRQRCAKESVWHTRTGPKYRAIGGYTHSNCLQRGGQHLIHQHATTLAILDIDCSHSNLINAHR
jgi:hypothetical protein